MKLLEVIKILEAAFPPETAYEWDNVGLLLGDKNAEISKVYLTLDITEYAVNTAIENGCELILSHHPMLFSGIKQITSDTQQGRIILSAAQKGIAIYAAHTNCDVAPSGINAYLSKLLDLTNVTNLEENGLGRIGQLKTECSLAEFYNKVKATLNLDFVRYCGDESKTIKTVAIGSGACADSIPTAIEKGADVMITGDTKYHTMLDFAKEIVIIDAGHYGTEIVVCDIFENLLKSCDVEIIRSTASDIYKLG